MNNKFQSQNGFTLIELLIGVIISAFVIIGVYAVFTTQNQSAVRTDALTEMNSSINGAVNLLERDLRMAGYHIPYSMALSPINNYGTGTVANDLDGGATLKTPLLTFLSRGIKTGTDAVLILQSDNLCGRTVNQVSDSGKFDPANGAHTGARVLEPNCFTDGVFAVNDIFLIDGPIAWSSEQRSGFFVKVTGITANAGTVGGSSYTSVDYTTLEKLNFWACPGRVSSSNPCPGDINWMSNQEIVRLQTRHLYYVDVSNRLSRLPLDTTFAPEPIAEGVEDLQLRYDQISTCSTQTTGPWTPCTDPGSSWPASSLFAGFSYVKTPALSCAAGSKCLPSFFLGETRAVHIGLVLRTLNEDRATYAGKGSPITLFDHTPTATTDAYHRKTINELIRVKNLELRDY